MKHVLHNVYDMLGDICEEENLSYQLQDRLMTVMNYILDETDGVEAVQYGMIEQAKGEG